MSNTIIRVRGSTTHRPFSSIIVRGISGSFAALAGLLLRILNILERPFAAGPDNRTNVLRLEGDLRWITERQRIQFTAWFAVIVVVVLVGGLLYASSAQIPTPRFLLALSATCVFWGILAIYLNYFFRPLKEPFASVFSYVAAFFFALLFGRWLIGLTVLDSLLGFLEW